MATSKSEATASGLDSVKLIAALVILTIGIFAYYFFSDSSNLLRVIGVLVSAGIAVAVFATTGRGKELGGFLKGSRTELRKIVWPTRQEALQTTLMVLVLVFIVGVFLWLVDMFLGWGVRQLISGA